MIENITNEDIEFLVTMLTFIAPVSISLRNIITSNVRKEVYPKGTVLLNPGSVSRRIFFIKSGFARAFYFDKEGREHTSWFIGPMNFRYPSTVFSLSSLQLKLLNCSIIVYFNIVVWPAANDYADHPELT